MHVGAYPHGYRYFACKRWVETTRADNAACMSDWVGYPTTVFADKVMAPPRAGYRTVSRITMATIRLLARLRALGQKRKHFFFLHRSKKYQTTKYLKMK